MAPLHSIVLLACASIAFTGCSHTNQPQHPKPPPKPAMKAPPPTPIEVKRQDLGGDTWDPQWNVLIEQSLPPDMLSARAGHAVRIYCPAFDAEPNADKRAFWAYLFQALAGAEAGLNPTIDVHHTQPILDKIDPVTKRPMRQEGLLQLAYADDDRYGCDFDWTHDRTLPIKDPDRTILRPGDNLRCGIKIMQNQIITQGKPLVSRTSYWSTLQPGTWSHRVFIRQMANVPAACGVHVSQVRRRR